MLSQVGVISKAKLQQVDITGNHYFSKREIQSWFKMRRGDAITEKDIYRNCQMILERLKEEGFYFAKFDSIRFDYSGDSSRVHIEVRLNEGKRLQVGQVKFEGLKDGHQLSDDLRTRTGRPFQHLILEEDIEAILRDFEGRGYPYCQVRIAHLGFHGLDGEQEATVDIIVQISIGPPVLIGEIEIRGNEVTKGYVIEREIGVKTGQFYNQRVIDKITPRLLKLGYFKWVNRPRLEWQSNETGKLILELEEGSSNRFDGVLGYNPPAQNSSGFITGLIDISFRNLLGTGRQIEARWERRTAKTQQLRFRYLEPWLAGLPLNLGFGFEQLIQDTIFVQRELRLDGRFLFNENFSLLSYVSTRDVSPDSLGQLLFGVPASQSLNLGVGLNLNTLDYPLNPQRGIHYETTFEWSRKKVDSIGENSDGSFNQKRIAIDFETYVSPFRWQVFAFGLHGRQITSGEDAISITDQYRLGGTRTLRGYREEQFRGSRIAWGNFEYRYLLNRYSRFFLFLDTGYFYREERVADNLLKFEEALIGFGFGLRLDTRLGFFGIDYGLGEGEGLSNGKVHISLINEF